MREDSPEFRASEEALIHVPPEFAVAESDVHVFPEDEHVVGSSLWKDAWRRLLKNKLAVFGLIVVLATALVSLIGPPIIKATTGFTYDYIPTDVNLIKSIPPLRSANDRSPGFIRW